MARISRKSVVLLPLVLSPLAVGARTADARSSDFPAVEVSVDRVNSSLGLAVHGAPLPAVLDAVARSTPTKFNHGPLSLAPLSVECEQASLPQVLECLLGADAHIAVRYAPAAGGVRSFPEEVWILHSGERLGGDSPEPLPIAEKSASGSGPKEPRPVKQADRETMARGMALAASSDPNQRAQGLQQLAGLGRRDDPGVQRLLEHAMMDADSGVRSQAVFGLGRYGDAESAAVLRQALRDGDVDVRLIAVETAGRDPEGIAVLREAMRDEDQDVSGLAAMKLELLDNPERTH